MLNARAVEDARRKPASVSYLAVCGVRVSTACRIIDEHNA